MDEEIRSRMLQIVPHIRFAIEEAKKKGVPALGVLCKFPDGGGKIEASFGIELLEDLMILIDAPPQTEKDNLNAMARQFVDQHLRMRELTDTLHQAIYEIRELRRQNEVLRAKVDTMELLSQFLHANVSHASIGMGEDIAWRMEKLLQQITDEENLPKKQAEEAAEARARLNA